MDNELDQIAEKERLVEIIERALARYSGYNLPVFYNDFLAAKMVYDMHADTVEKLVKNFNIYEDMLAEEYKNVSQDELEKIEKRELIKEKVFTFMQKSGIIPKAYCKFRARQFAYALDLNNQEQMGVSFEEYSNILVEEYKNKYLVQSATNKIRVRVLNFMNMLKKKG